MVVVLGMHRSGTSAVTRGLQVMGVGLGEKLMAPNPDVNAKGFWEDVDLNALNIEMLQALGSDWYHMAPITTAEVVKLCQLGFLQRAVELLQEKIGDAPVFGLKDPRMAKLLLFWKEVFSQCRCEVRYVLTIRHPLSVAQSLKKRDGLDVVTSYMLWLEHVLEGLAGTVDSKRVIVDYDLLMRSPEHELQRIADRLNLAIDPVALESYKSGFLDEGLRHSVHTLGDLLADDACPPLVGEVYQVLSKAASGSIEDDDLLRSKGEAWRQECRRIAPLLRFADRMTTQNALLAQELNLGDIRLGVESSIISERDKEIVELKQWVSKQDARIVELDEQAGKLNARVAELSAQVVELGDETVRRGEWALSLDGQLKQAQATIAQITASTSWRITLPLRELRRWLGTPKQQAVRYLRRGLRFGKAVYLRLPLSAKTRNFLRRFVSRYVSWMLRGSNDLPIVLQSTQQKWVTVPSISDLARAAKEIRLATSPQPVVSVIIPVYGQCEYTLRCLLSIIAYQPETPYEVIVVDDHSPDDSYAILRQVSGIRLVHNEVNQGFIRSCNNGSRVAKGEFVYFLNNDTQVTAGWLDELLDTFALFPGTGLAGSKLVYPDGTLQEAGGIIWQDGSAWNFGRNQDPSEPKYNYAREVDFCSGASIMVPRQLYEQLGGFDEHYLPAYCEDADLALKIRDRGYRVIYQPLSAVVHFEGVTSGTDTSKGVKAYQVENLKKLYERWQGRLQYHRPNGVEADSEKDRGNRRRVLVLDHCTPTPEQDAGSVIIFNMLVLLREMGYQVTFIPEDNFLHMDAHTPALQRAGIEVLYAPYFTSVDAHLKECGDRYELALVVRPVTLERNIRAIRRYCPSAKVLFHTVDLHYLRMSREAALQSDSAKLKEAEEMKEREFAAIRASDASIVVSTAELELLGPELPDCKLFVFPLIMEVPGTTVAFAERRDIVFVGGYQHMPNVDAVQYFVSAIMPVLRERLPGVRFHVVGSKPPAEIFALASDDVIIVGFVEDLNSLLNRMRVSVVPLRYGAGIKGKIGSAMAVGLPVVATSIASEGMSLANGENILVEDDPDAFAAAVARLYDDEALWTSISEASISFADNQWGAEAAWKRLADILAGMDIRVERDDRPLKLYAPKGR